MKVNFLNSEGKFLAIFPSFCVPEDNEYLAGHKHQDTKGIQLSLAGVVIMAAINRIIAVIPIYEIARK